MRYLTAISSVLEKIKNYCITNQKIMTVYIFGSFGTEMQTALSDVDIAILFNDTPSVLDELKHASEISSILGTEQVDVINLNTAPVQLQHEILRTGTKIFEREPEKTMDFVEYVLGVYHDYEGILRKFHEDYKQGLKEEYLHG